MRLKYNPRGANIDLTVLCNQACAFCWRADVDEVRKATVEAPHKVMPRETFDRVVRAVAEVETIDALGLNGPMGDPLLVPDLADRAHFARATGRFRRKLLMNTNGVAWDRHNLKHLVSGFSQIIVSLDAIDPDLHEAIHGKRGQLAGILQGINAMMRVRRPGQTAIKVRFTEHSRNARHWPEFERVMTRRVDGIMRRRIHSFMDLLPEHGASGAALCDQPYQVVNIDYQGNLTTCCVNWRRSPSFGLVSDAKSLRAAWNGATYETWRGRRHEDVCKGCSGLGGQVQRITGATMGERRRAADIRRMGEMQYWEKASQ